MPNYNLQGRYDFLTLRDGYLTGSYNTNADGKNKNNQFIKKGENFAITLNDAYFKYLPDFMNDNEILLIFVFEEKGIPNTGKDKKDKPFLSEKFVRVIGPIPGIADRGKISEINSYIYGPKAFEGDLLEMSVYGIEFDQDEKIEREQVLDYLGKLTKDLSTFIPADTATVTSGVFDFLSFLNKLDRNDNVIRFKTTFVPFVEDKNENSRYLPIRDSILIKKGQYVLIKQEFPKWFGNFNYFSKSAEINNGIDCLKYIYAIPLDILFFPFRLIANVIADVPDRNAVRELKKEPKSFPDESQEKTVTEKKESAKLSKQKIEVFKEKDKYLKLSETRKSLYIEKDNDKTHKDYDQKTWLSFTVDTAKSVKLWPLLKAEQENKDLDILFGKVDINKTIKDSKLSDIFKSMITILKNKQDKKAEKQKRQEEQLKKLFNVQ